MSALSPRQFFLLDQACKPIFEAFGETPFLVGTALGRGPFRDVDVRLIFNDVHYDALRHVIGVSGIAFLGLAIGQYVASLTGLPIDFQVQRRTEASAQHEGPRNPLGCRSLDDFEGDCIVLSPEDGAPIRFGGCPCCSGREKATT